MSIFLVNYVGFRRPRAAKTLHKWFSKSQYSVNVSQINPHWSNVNCQLLYVLITCIVTWVLPNPSVSCVLWRNVFLIRCFFCLSLSGIWIPSLSSPKLFPSSVFLPRRSFWLKIRLWEESLTPWPQITWDTFSLPTVVVAGDNFPGIFTGYCSFVTSLHFPIVRTCSGWRKVQHLCLDWNHCPSSHFGVYKLA